MVHTPVKGYRELNEGELAAMNSLKLIEEDVLLCIKTLQDSNLYTQRWLAIARTDIQTGFMAANRAIARPNNETS